MQLINENTGNQFTLQEAGYSEEETGYFFYQENVPCTGFFLMAQKSLSCWDGWLQIQDSDGSSSVLEMPAGEAYESLDECLAALELFLAVDYWQAPQALGI